MSKPNQGTKERPQVTREQWIEAALYAWGEGGFSAVAVEPLAKRLGVTKGSFYWHFKNRPELVQAALELWRDLGTRAVIAELEELEDPAAQLRNLFRLAWDRLDRLRAEAAIGAAALTGDIQVRPIYEDVQRTRLDYVTRLYKRLGFSAVVARRRAVATYSAFLGSLQVVFLEQEGLRTAAQLAAQVKVFEELLIPG